MNDCNFCGKEVRNLAETKCEYCKENIYVCLNCVPSERKHVFETPEYYSAIVNKHYSIYHSPIDVI